MTDSHTDAAPERTTPPPHKPGDRIIHIPVIIHLPRKHTGIKIIMHHLRQLIRTKIIISILQCLTR